MAGAAPVADLSPSLAAGARARRAVMATLPRPLQRRIRTLRGRPPPRTIGLAELDGELARAGELYGQSQDDARRFLDSFEMTVPPGRPEDPFSAAYRDWVWAAYRQVSGHDSYSAASEASPFDVDEAVGSPYPYSTGSTAAVGEDLMGRGFVIRALGLRPPARIVEFGSGWGNLTIDLVSMGFEVTSVEVERRFSSLLEHRNRRPELLRTVSCDMLEFEPDEAADAVIFYSSFHHCADHVEMLHKLAGMIHRSGKVLWAAEPVSPLPYPWGLRLDGYSLWSTRTYGWLELGFDQSYFAQVLARTGWRARRQSLLHVSPLADVIVAER